jgi:hypothetical protein
MDTTFFKILKLLVAVLPTFHKKPHFKIWDFAVAAIKCAKNNIWRFWLPVVPTIQIQITFRNSNVILQIGVGTAIANYIWLLNFKLQASFCTRNSNAAFSITFAIRK